MLKSSLTKSVLSLTILSAAMFGLLATPAVAEQDNSKPKLVLQITVDQLRGDLPFRYQDRLGKNGFNYLLNQGTVYRDAHHAHANTETIVGHVTLATGAHPANHGLIGNMWYDRKSGTTVYNVEDANYSLLSKNADIDKSTEIDPTQKAATVDGRSPMNIQSSTFSDEMIISTNGKAKVFGVSVKDRGAISLAGHGGKAFWFSKANNEFITSNYYYDQYPQWVTDWNKKKFPEQFSNKKWELMNDKSTYLFGEDDDSPWEFKLGEYGTTFPHEFGDKSSPYFSTLLTVSPIGDEMTVDFAKELIVNEDLGKDNITDFLAISLSSTDYIGHFFGASSLESEDNMLRLDKTLADLFAYVDKHVGLENTVIVLSADHGGPEAPGYLHEHKVNGDYVSAKQWDELDVVAKVKAELGIKEQLISNYSQPYVYLDHEVIKKHKLSIAVVQDKIASALMSMDDVFLTVASNRLATGDFPDTKLHRAILKNYSPKRSGDVYMVYKPHDFINNLDGLKVAVVHGSPWTYDTFVPVIFAGKGIPAQHIYRKVNTVDVAPTLSAILNIKQPSANEGLILNEVFKKEEEKGFFD
ncbi:alkaline phosphatase family protein [Thalassomonas sp. M1454]|uniref:alkaline phosphatase family protein n=1 Tax=Thalassomonas sp. M1454 TaxID=2594477 RepID=UPI001180A3DF|nr:alkaline phosphatase family protein [Thalassomonas sp. M1454]TRX56526.1 alkaline phosphatase family protein [Thalassomonas sp. M1454]